MPLRVAINGFGRIGRSILRAKYQSRLHPDIEIVAINDLGSPKALAHLVQYDSTYGPFKGDISVEESDQAKLKVNQDSILLLQQANAKLLPWKDLEVDLVLESSGQFRSKALAQQHIHAGAKKVLIGAPAFDEVDHTIVYGVNQNQLLDSDQIISNASCTTNCLAPLINALLGEVEIQSGLLTTIHSYSNNQHLIDSVHDDLRRARSATQSLIPTSSGALSALEKVLPSMQGIFNGYSMRVPTLDVAAVDITLQLATETSADAINALIKQAAENDAAGILSYCDAPLVSIDFKGHSSSAIFDSLLTKTAGKQVKLVAWYDNEWAYAHRMLDVSAYLYQQFFSPHSR
ncbi:MAG: type I glyceraldehyde-3-phosphate dehydrogenase [Pseudomonadales bacterium]|nr:type I glyceraldehyde-3-phosphate dehydrogenase [Pseudomonadales bacterium]